MRHSIKKRGTFAYDQSVNVIHADSPRRRVSPVKKALFAFRNGANSNGAMTMPRCRIPDEDSTARRRDGWQGRPRCPRDRKRTIAQGWLAATEDGGGRGTRDSWWFTAKPHLNGERPTMISIRIVSRARIQISELQVTGERVCVENSMMPRDADSGRRSSPQGVTWPTDPTRPPDRCQAPCQVSVLAVVIETESLLVTTHGRRSSF